MDEMSIKAKGKSGRETMESLMQKGVEYCLPFYVDVHGRKSVV